MEKERRSLEKLTVNQKPSSKPTTIISQSSSLPINKRRTTPSLVNLCLEVVGKHLEDLVPDLAEIVANFPADIKIVIAAIARRRKLLTDDVVIPLADSLWQFLDVSGSDVSDFGLMRVAQICSSLRAVDISRCHKITAVGVSELVQHCNSLETLRCGGCPTSEKTARRCLGIFKPKLNDIEGDSWEELDTAEIMSGAQSLRWLVWPKIDEDSLESFSTECPRIILNPKPSLFGFKGSQAPREAWPNVTIDDVVVEDIDPKTWAVSRYTPAVVSTFSLSSDAELTLAEKFRMAFEERDSRLAPKRAKNARQHQRRAEREWVMMSPRAKALALASRVNKTLYNWN